MNIFDDKSELNIRKPVVSIGMFDGVHRGHISLINEVNSRAELISGESLLITFEPHPRIVLGGTYQSPGFLTGLDEKKILLERSGINNLLVLPFTIEMSRLSACDFIRQVLVEKVRISHLVMGFDHHFGYRGEGNLETVRKCALDFGFDVTKVEALTENNITVSSTTIRDKLASGKLSDANMLLGYEYFLNGKVIRGKRIGHKMGYPTANIIPSYSYKIIPSDGVYAVEVNINSDSYLGMLYIGRRPTSDGWEGELTIEVNIFNFEGDLYDRDLTVIFKHYLRGDKKFENMRQLYSQIEKDREETLRLLG